MKKDQAVFGRLVQKELLHHLLDFRFIAVFALCALLSALSVYVGGLNYARQLREYSVVSETNRRASQVWLDNGSLSSFAWVGYRWNRRPEVLMPVVYGLSGIVGQEVDIQFEHLPEFEGGVFETDPVHVLFGVIDLAFLVKVVLSLSVLLFTYDAICGEKEGGTLRLYASFPVARSTLAAAKLVGSIVTVLVPFSFAYLLVSAVLALSPGLGLQAGEWGRMAALMGVFALYLVVFAAFGLWTSALTHRRITAFLGLLGLWTAWVFVVPDAAVYVARRLIPAKTVYERDSLARAFHREARGEAQAEADAYLRNQGTGDRWWEAPEARQQEIREALRNINSKWDAVFYARLRDLQSERRNQMQRQQRLASLLSAISPFSAVTLTVMDLARTGLVQQERVEIALDAHLSYLARFIREKQALPSTGRVLTDFAWFTYQDNETVGECLSRNLLYILNLALLAILGFAGAYVAILRYDVR